MITKNHKRMLLGLLISIMFFISIPPSVYAAESKFPTRPINLYVPYPAGGNVDLITRALADAASKTLGQPIICINKAGATGTLAPASVKSMKPDGYNLCIELISLIYISLQQDVPYDPLKDFTHISRLYNNVFGIVVRSDAPWKTFKEFIDYAKANPGKVKYASSALGGTPHLVMSEIALKEGIKWEIVPFKGGPETVTAVLGGHVQVMAQGPDWVPHVESGELRLLAITGEERIRKYANVPCLRELGYSPFLSTQGLLGPAGMPKDIVDRLDEAFKEAVSAPEVKKVMDILVMNPSYLSSKDYIQWINETYVNAAKIIREIGLSKK